MRKRASGTFLAAKSEEAVLRGQAAQGAAIPPGGPRRSKVRRGCGLAYGLAHGKDDVREKARAA